MEEILEIKYTDKAGISHDLVIEVYELHGDPVYKITRDGDPFIEIYMNSDFDWSEVSEGTTERSREYGEFIEHCFE